MKNTNLPTMKKPSIVFSMATEETGEQLGVINITGYIGWDEAEALAFRDRVEVLINSGATRLVVRINSPGGSVWDALAIYELLQSLDIPVETEAFPLAASAASLLLQVGEKRRINANGKIMIHPATAGIYGTIEDLKRFVATLEKDQLRVWQIYAARCGQTIEDFINAHRQDTWYTAEEALVAGLVDEITNSEEPSEVSPEDTEAAGEDTPSEEEGEEEEDPIAESALPEEDGEREDADAAEEDDEDEEDSPAAVSGITASLARLHAIGAAVGLKVFTASAQKVRRAKMASHVKSLKAQVSGLQMQVRQLERDNATLAKRAPKVAARQSAAALAAYSIPAEQAPAVSAAQCCYIDMPRTRGDWNHLSAAEKIAVMQVDPDIKNKLK